MSASASHKESFLHRCWRGLLGLGSLRSRRSPSREITTMQQSQDADTEQRICAGHPWSFTNEGL